MRPLDAPGSSGQFVRFLHLINLEGPVQERYRALFHNVRAVKPRWLHPCTAAGQVVVIMGADFSAIRTLIVPAIIALILYLVLTFAVIPIWQRYRNRYSQYLPLETITDGASSLRARLTDRITTWFITSAWRARLQDRIDVADNRPSTDFDSDDGEELNEVDEALRRALERREQPTIDDSNRRLSRESVTQLASLGGIDSSRRRDSLNHSDEWPISDSDPPPSRHIPNSHISSGTYDDPALFTHVVPRNSGSGIVGLVPPHGLGGSTKVYPVTGNRSRLPLSMITTKICGLPKINVDRDLEPDGAFEPTGATNFMILRWQQFVTVLGSKFTICFIHQNESSFTDG
ncbi:uncharacterized protein B0T23DRAFT_401501 [Neurospora hispaniola]|uniref:Uncharacterized protein n=1 Tax=Neurospora hispaniola TaxID=588809 RepID=A0AAJ0IGI2_9PEZI|nr:hypothetical protein B0T23DRAFT_401501 [Neurospora hispaniola]